MVEQNENNEKKGSKEFSLSTLAVDNGTTVFFITFIILLFGVSAYVNMPKEQFPDATFPTVFVNTVHFGNSATDIETLVTRPIEKELMSVTGIKDVKSTSMQDYSIITAEYITEIDMNDALRKTKDAVDKAKSELPNDLTQDPLVMEVNTAAIPILTVNVAGNYTNEQLKEYAEYLQDKIEDIDEISEVQMKGALETEVKVDMDIPKMEALRVSFGDVENAIKMENMNMSGGEMVTNGFRRAVKVNGEFENVRELENLIIKSENQNPIYLKNIASVKMGYKDKTSIARANRMPVVSLDVIKRKGENLLSSSDKINEVIAKAKKEKFPEALQVTTFNDQSIATRDQVSNLENSIVSGVILVVVVLLFFLGLRNAMFVGLAIPLSMLMGFMILNLIGYTINMVVLFALILALGLLVDNGIVVVENIYRYMQEGYSGKRAAKYGAGEVALPIIASTATTLAAFFPLAFWPGIMGSFMKYLPITLIIVLLSSLFVALVINPVFTATFMKVDQKAATKKARNRQLRNNIIGVILILIFAALAHLGQVDWLRNLLVLVAIITLLNMVFLRPASFYFQEKILPALERFYYKFVNLALYKFTPVVVFVGTIFLMIGSFVLLGIYAPKVLFFPDQDPLYVNAFVELPMGKDIEETNAALKDLEDKVIETVEPYSKVVESVLSQIGENTSDPNAPPEPGASPNKARITVAFVPSKDRDGISTTMIKEKIRDSMKGYPGLKIVVDQNAAGPPVGKPINLEITGEEIDELSIMAEKLIAHINSKNIGGIEELKADVNLGKPEVEVNIDREAARRYGVSTYNIASSIRTAIFGSEVSSFKIGEDEYPIFVRVDEKYRNNIDAILNQRITFRSPANGQISQVPISSVSDIRFTSTYSSIQRKNQKRVVTISSNLLDGYYANDIVPEIEDLMEDYDLSEGMTYAFTGEQQSQTEEMEFLSSALMIALFSIFVILVAQFNSFISPFIILISVLFSTIGVFLGYVMTSMDIIVIMTGIGIISLAGVVVNNAIVLIDYVNLLVQRKREDKGLEDMSQLSDQDIKDAIIQGGATRLRPVLLTAITTVLGLIPLAIGFNFNFFTFISELDGQYFLGGDNVAFWGPMAWTVIYGLIFATFLTLIVVPVMYWLAYRAKSSIKKVFKPNKNNIEQLEMVD